MVNSPDSLKTPIAFLIFNRPGPTQRVFAQIARARPPALFLIADGPRSDHPSDAEKCQAVRRIVDTVDWPCRVFRNYSETNLGLAKRITGGINWIFDTVDECIILEDDCLPSTSFFSFCDQLLERYRHDERIMHINGYSYQFGRVRTEDSYYFSRVICPWGWATWRRAWQHYDFRVRRWAALRETDWLRDVAHHPLTIRYFQRHFDMAYRGELDTYWSFQWTFACLSQSALSISPRNDLIMNLGMGVDATHSMEGGEVFHRPSSEMPFPLRHPTGMVRNLPAEAFWIQLMAEMEARPEHRPLALKLYARLPVSLRRVVRSHLPQRLRRYLAGYDPFALKKFIDAPRTNQ